MSLSFDSVVVGAGIVGSACALELARSGMRVALVDPLPPGMGATAAGMGHIVVMDDSPAQFRLTHYSRQLWDGVVADLPAACEYARTGTLWIAADQDEMQEVLRKNALFREYEVTTDVVDAATLRQIEPGLRGGLSGALLVPGDGVVYAPAVARFLAELAEDAGATRMSTRIVSLGGGEARLETGDRLLSPRIVNAAGEWATALTPGLPIKRRKGHLAITDRYPGLIHHQLVELGYLKSAHATLADSVAFNIQPRISGQLLIGSSRQYGAESGTVDYEIVSNMLDRAVSYLPVARNLSVLRLWTGFRAATPDKLPLIGPWPADDTVFLATGHEGLGITTSLGTARLLADWLCGRESRIPIDAYLPQRTTAWAADA